MAGFTTRPEIRGTFGVVALDPLAASAVGMSILEKGGNAFDAAAAAGLSRCRCRAENQRPTRRSPDARVERGEPSLRHDLRPGCGTRSRDDRQVPRARARF